MSDTITTPIVVYMVHHPDCEQAKGLAQKMYKWFRLSNLGGEDSAAGLPVYYRRALKDQPTDKDQTSSSIKPSIDWERAELNVVIVLVDHRMVLDPQWRSAIITLAERAKKRRAKQHRALLLPVALHESFYRMEALYEHFNPIRLLGMTAEEQEATLRRAVTEAATRSLRGLDLPEQVPPPKDDKLDEVQPPPLNIFLSHAKRDGIQIAEHLRDSVRNFGQLVAWYDANDLPYGYKWQSPMVQAAKEETAAMVAAVTDAYPTRPWCRMEAKLARTPRLVDGHTNIWTVQPLVAVVQPSMQWVRGLSMLAGVPRIGWDDNDKNSATARVVDRVVLEMLLFQTHRRVAERLADTLNKTEENTRTEVCFITWVPDTWSLIALRQQMIEKKGAPNPTAIKKIVYPGYSLRIAETEELKAALDTFSRETTLRTYQEEWP